MIKFSGLIAPTEVPTGDGRMFAAGKMTHRPTPIPLMARFGSGGHENATPVGTINRIYDGPGGYWCEGEFLDPAMVPEVPKAVYLLGKKVLGPSVDLDRDFTVEAIPHPTRPDKKAGMFKEYNVIGITLVPMPAFHQVHMSVTDEAPAPSLLASCFIDNADWVIEPVGFSIQDAPDEETFTKLLGEAMFDVNGTSWRNWPIAPRDYTFDADDAVKRIAYWAGIGSKTPSVDHYASTFLWRNGGETGDTLAQDSFRLPLADIINGQPYLVYHAVYSAAALLSGAHGGLPQIPEEDKAVMVRVINEIYSVLADAFQDPNLKSPFLVGIRPEEMAITSQAALDTDDCGCNNGVVSETANFQGNPPEAGVQAMSQSITVNANGQAYTLTTEAPTSAVTVTFTPANLPLDVLKSMQEEKRPYGDDGCHFDENGMCMKCGY